MLKLILFIDSKLRAALEKALHYALPIVSSQRACHVLINSAQVHCQQEASMFCSLCSPLRARVWVAALAIIAGVPFAAAQTYPAKPIRLVVPFPPGGPLDVIARTIGQKATEDWGQPVIVD